MRMRGFGATFGKLHSAHIAVQAHSNAAWLAVIALLELIAIISNFKIVAVLRPVNRRTLTCGPEQAVDSPEPLQGHSG